MAVPDEDFLINAKVITRPCINFREWSSNSGDGFYDPFIVSQLVVAKDLIKKASDTEWILHQIGSKLIIPDDFKKDFNLVKVDIINCLPIPQEDIDFEKVLNFKVKRHDELEGLHSSIDDIYFDILNSPDKKLQSQKSTSDFQKAIQNLDKSMNEKFKIIKKYDLTAEISIDGSSIFKALGITSCMTFLSSGISIPVTSLLAGIVSCINIKASASRTFESEGKNSKLTYLANASKQRIIK
jgi:hypothetical protein